MSKEAAEKEFTKGGKPVKTTDTDKAKTNIASPNMRPGYTKVLGGLPPEKHVDEVERINTPEGRKRAPGSVRV